MEVGNISSAVWIPACQFFLHQSSKRRRVSAIILSISRCLIMLLPCCNFQSSRENMKRNLNGCLKMFHLRKEISMSWSWFPSPPTHYLQSEGEGNKKSYKPLQGINVKIFVTMGAICLNTFSQFWATARRCNYEKCCPGRSAGESVCMCLSQANSMER